MNSINNTRLVLGESPIWHPLRSMFYWVDIVSHQIFYLTHDNKAKCLITLSDKVGCIVPTSDGHLLAALSNQLLSINLDTLKQQPISDKCLPECEMFNDGKVDALGRLWIASKDVNEQSGLGKLYCFDGETFSVKAHDLIVGNGIDWSPDNRYFYLCDSPRQVIYRFSYDEEGADIFNRQIFASIECGYPDGLTIDSAGNLWNGHWAGSRLTCYAPNGDIKDELTFNAKNITSVTFGGKNFKTMLITSASRDIESNDVNDDGFVFLHQSDYQGKQANMFKCVI